MSETPDPKPAPAPLRRRASFGWRALKWTGIVLVAVADAVQEQQNRLVRHEIPLRAGLGPSRRALIHAHIHIRVAGTPDITRTHGAPDRREDSAVGYSPDAERRVAT